MGDGRVAGVSRVALGIAAAVPAGALAFLAYEMLTSAYPAIIFNGGRFFTTGAFAIGNSYGTSLETHHGFHAFQGASFGVLRMVFG
ncbi:MAG: hypothetical protein ACYC1D_12940, partial [Acidimicrobiales bacterium]